MQPCVFDTPKCTKVLERTAKKCEVRVTFRNLSSKYFRECVQPCVFSVPKCTRVLERTIKACGVRIIRNIYGIYGTD